MELRTAKYTNITNSASLARVVLTTRVAAVTEIFFLLAIEIFSLLVIEIFSLLVIVVFSFLVMVIMPVPFSLMPILPIMVPIPPIIVPVPSDGVLELQKWSY